MKECYYFKLGNGFMDTHIVLSSAFQFIIENLSYKKLYKNIYSEYQSYHCL